MQWLAVSLVEIVLSFADVKFFKRCAGSFHVVSAESTTEPMQATNSFKLQFRQFGYQNTGVYSQHLIKLGNLVVLLVLIHLWQKKVGNNYITFYGT